MSDVERRYFNLIGSGKIFDQAAARPKKAENQRTRLKSRIINNRAQLAKLKREVAGKAAR
ncbi:MAG: hypothetical protein ACJARE_003716 [Paracoccaceae bacterium]